MLGAELAQAYKPKPEVYLSAPRFLGLQPEQVLMVACHPWDLVGAAKAGLPTAYVHRSFESGPTHAVAMPETAGFDIAVDDFGELAARLGV